MDPPYEADDEYALALGLLGGEASRLLAEDALVIAEHRRREKLDERYGVLERTRVLEQGDAALSFYRSSSLARSLQLQLVSGLFRDLESRDDGAPSLRLAGAENDCE